MTLMRPPSNPLPLIPTTLTISIFRWTASNAVLNATADKDSLSPQMQRMMNRQAENTRRVEETIKGTKSDPRWFVPLFCALMIIGLVWAVVYYLTSDYPIPNIGAWNLAIAFAIIMVGFIMASVVALTHRFTFIV